MAVHLDYETLKSRLLEERAELEQDVRRLEEVVDDISNARSVEDGGVSNHMADGATNTFLQERNLALLDNLRRTLRLIDAALRRLEAGTYGLCENCGRQIDPARLEALPYAVRCMDCQIRLEES